jgi:peptidylprolyl isomerase/peptidyl-prolyl cis-trans isomerase D
MGAMNKLRQNTGVILWILVLSFGIIWTLQDSNVFEAMNQPSQNVAMVNGQSISNQEYNNAVERQRQRFQQQMQGEMSGRMEEMMRQRAYDQLINNTLLEQEMERLGITVTDAEVEQMVFGENPHPFIRRQFADSTGQINYQLLNNMAQNPQAKSQWIQIEQMLRQDRRRQKMGSLVQSTIHISEADIKEYHWRQNASASVDYVALRYASVPNDSISVSESDLRSYYQNNKEDFKRKKTLTLDYVTLSKTPTAQDTTMVFRNLERNRDEFASTTNDSLFLARNSSERPFSSSYQTPTQMDESVADSVFASPTAGRIVGPVAAGGLAHLVKIRDSQPADKDYVHAHHILLQSNEEDPALRQRLQSIRDSIESGAATFARMARQYSQDQSASDGGDLGWFGRGTMADRFEQAAFDASPGELVGPVRSEFGYHLIRVTGTASSAVQIADLAFTLEPGQSTLTDKRNTLGDVAFYAEESSSFADEAKSRNLEINQVQAEADQQSIPGLGQTRAFPSFMETAETGDISDVIELDDKFALLKVTEVKPEGYRPFEEVKAQIRPQVELRKKQAVQAQRMRRALEQNSFQSLPRVLGTQLRTESDVTFSTTTVPGVGSDPAFSGTVFGLDPGETSGVVEGENAAFVVRVTSMQEPPALTEAQHQQIRQQLLKQRQKEVSSQWIAALKEDATIKDQRSQFQ